ncbi:ABC transporter permease [Methylobrevis pamukkalensis]|uniref:Autoinducer 2 import system permease protein LsrC n=1 Tax=Methylobrevis pamukkalensis TaxID=1439726 RepID=A0A1E3H677_9HYPH|nr:ABC transporter permease [Methylobrevis pamukkalensis]ODN71822.1 Autoinducer 2 import system permease protein LsrC [Methylobrevis pamukkalensis]
MTRLLGGREATLAAACLVAALVFAAASPVFLTPGNLLTVLRNSTELLLAALGMTLLLAMGAIDVSIGMAMGLAAIVVGQLLMAGIDPALAGIAGPLAGAALGLVAGAVVAFGKIPAIVATLGLLGVYRAGIFLTLGGAWLSGIPTGLTDLVATPVLGVPPAIVLIGLAYLAVFVLLRRTPFGPHLLAVGNSDEKARLSGIAVTRIRLMTFVVAGALAGLAATFYIATYRNVSMTIGATLPLEAIAAAVLGGTSILGGRCTLVGTVLGVILIRLMQNGLLLVGVPSLWQPVVTGAMLLIVLGLEAGAGSEGLRRLVRRPA